MFNHSEANLAKANWILNFSIKSWAGIALAGQWAFAIYVFSIYVLTLMFNMDITIFSPASGTHKTEGVDTGVFFLHIIPAIFLALFGLFQLVPTIRKRYPRFHRWNGRIFFVFSLSGALTGLYLTWAAGLRFSDLGSMGVTLNGILIPIAIGLAWYHAVNRNIAAHMRWAVHSFLLVNGVWTFRLYLMGWFMVNQGPNGNSRAIDGPMDITLSFASYLLPMAIAELVFWAKRQKQSQKVFFSAIGMSIGALITLVGVVAVVMMMWWPRVVKVVEALP